ncbi:MAG: hypothetical protein K2K97_00090 [Muribaculaceae bacterium]|nr:hypothetical protein [Muribaculaceae bacterium]
MLRITKAMILAAGALLLPPVIDAQVLEPAAVDLGHAYEWCDSSELMQPEGIWEFPDDQTTVLIKRMPQSARAFDIFIIDTPDCRLNPGEKLGELHRSVDSNKFKLNLFTRRNMGILTDSRLCSAELKESGDAFILHPRNFKISFRTMWFLPKFWRSLKVSVDNPASKLPYGLTRIYPRTSPLSPFYL